jgi:hypothetical protein
MTILNRFAGSTNKNTLVNPSISGLSIAAANTSSITLNLTAVAQLYVPSRVTISLTPTIYNSSNSLGCHSILKSYGYSGPTLLTQNYSGSTFPTTVTATGLYYDSEYLLTLSVITSVSTDYYSIVASTANPDDIIIIANTSNTLADINYNDTNSSLGPLVIPRNVSSACAVVIGGGGSSGGSYGGGGAGGALAYGNALAFSPGTFLSWQVGNAGNFSYKLNGGNTYIVSSSYLQASGGSTGVLGNSVTGGGGGGAGGYSGNGGAGGQPTTVTSSGGTGGTSSGTARSGGGNGGNGGGGNAGVIAVNAAGAASGGSGAGGSGGFQSSYSGGGVGLYGQSSVNNNGLTTTAGAATLSGGAALASTNGGSGGTDGTGPTNYPTGGNYGGGGGSGFAPLGGPGALRICFNKINGTTRAFPSTGVSTVPTNQYIVIF